MIDTYFNPAIVCFPPTNKNSLNYLYYILPIAIRNLSRVNIYGAPIYTSGILKNLLIPLPPIDTQKTVSSFLDRKCSLLQQLFQKIDLFLKKLEEYQEALLYDTLVHQKTSTTIIKLKYLSTLKGRIGWQALTTHEYQQQGAYLVTGVNIQQGVIDWSSCHHVSEERYEMDKNIQLQEQDLIITKDGTIGKVAIIQNIPSIATLNSHLILIRSKSKGVYFEKYL